MTYWYVMLIGINGHPIPLTASDGSICLFKSYEKAEEAGADHLLGKANGFDVIDWDYCT